MDLSVYYLKVHYLPSPTGERTENRVHRKEYDEDLWYILYNGGKDLIDSRPGQKCLDCIWMWCDWYSATKEERQVWYKEQIMKNTVDIPKTYQEPYDVGYLGYVAKIYNDSSCRITRPNGSQFTTGRNVNWRQEIEKDMKNNIMLVDYPVPQPCAPATTSSGLRWKNPIHEEIPMKTMTTSTDITFQTPPSEAAVAREYLLSELNERTRYSYRDPVYPRLRKMFNLDAPAIPETSQEIIDAFKNGRVEIDQKKVDAQTKYFAARKNDEDYDDDFDSYDENSHHIGSRYYGVKFLDLPIADRKGFDAAVTAYEKAKKDVKSTIMVFGPEKGLEALTALEDWTPTGVAN